MYDVFKNISEDEAEHVKTMIACQDYARVGKLIVSPHLTYSEETEENIEEKRKNWKDWADSLNEMNSYETNSNIGELE
jgi:sugar phosphate isomerase/epimerase